MRFRVIALVITMGAVESVVIFAPSTTLPLAAFSSATEPTTV